MRAKVDQDTCIGCELCVDTCPQVFEMNGDKADVIVAIVPFEEEESCQQAADDCPVEAISIIE